METILFAGLHVLNQEAGLEALYRIRCHVFLFFFLFLFYQLPISLSLSPPSLSHTHSHTISLIQSLTLFVAPSALNLIALPSLSLSLTHSLAVSHSVNIHVCLTQDIQSANER